MEIWARILLEHKVLQALGKVEEDLMKIYLMTLLPFSIWMVRAKRLGILGGLILLSIWIYHLWKVYKGSKRKSLLIREVYAKHVMEANANQAQHLLNVVVVGVEALLISDKAL